MLSLYTETVFQPRSIEAAKRVEGSVPRANGSYDRSKYSDRPRRTNRLASDESTYSLEYLATSSSIFTRSTNHHYPRSFLWRVVANSRLLEIQVADFSRNESDKEHDRLLAFEFQDAIAQRGISVCEKEKNNAICFFVLTETNEIHRLVIEVDRFAGGQAATAHTPVPASSLTIDTAHQIHAVTPDELYISFTSGRIQRCQKDEGQDTWTCTTYDDKSWAVSLLSVVSRKAFPDIEHNGKSLAYNTAQAMTRSGNFLFTTCLNHCLRVWHLPSGRLADNRDLLDQSRELQDRIQLNPSEPGNLKILEGGSDQQRTLLTYSPLNGGTVKLWTVSDLDAEATSTFNIVDKVPTRDLKLPDPDPVGNSVWSLAGLDATYDKHTKQYQMWVLWRNNNYHKAYTLNFTLGDPQNAWAQDWLSVSTTAVRSPAPEFIVSIDEDVSEKWLQHIMTPGRYSHAVIETALTQYQRAADIKLSAGERNRSLAERLCLIIASQVSLRKVDDSAMDYDRFAIDTDQQWRQFWRMLDVMNEARYAPLALACDSHSGQVYFAMTDMCCAVRECNDIELLQLNDDKDLVDVKRVFQARWPHRKVAYNSHDAGAISTLVRASRDFRRKFPAELAQQFQAEVEEDLYTDSPLPASQRIIDIFNTIDYANAIPPEVEKDLVKEMDRIGGFSAITNDRIDILLQLMSRHRQRERKPSYVKTGFGIDLTMKALLDEIVTLADVLLSLLAIVIFVDESENFDPARSFTQLVDRLKVQERNLWLATHDRQATGAGDEQPRAVVSVMRDMYANTLRPVSTENHPMPYVVTHHVLDNMDFISGNNQHSSEYAAVYLQCNLLKNANLDLATQFIRFTPSTPWSTYIKGRLSVGLHQFSQAAHYFRAASAPLATGKALGDMHETSAGLLTNDQAASFFDGLPKYLEHVLSLFEDQSAFSFAAEFAHEALAAIEEDQREPIVNFKQDITLRLFNAELACHRYSAAFGVLEQFDDPLLQRNSCTDLIDAMLGGVRSLSSTAAIVAAIQALPWSDNPQLAAQLETHLSSLASKQSTLPSSGLWLKSSTVDYLSVLQALRLSRDDYRGAMRCLFDRLRLVQRSSHSRVDPQSTSLRHALLALINVMSCIDQNEAYIVADANQDPRLGSAGAKRKAVLDNDKREEKPAKQRKRIVITLEDLRKEYQQVLDKCSRIERGDFELGDEDDMSDGDVDMTFEGSKLEGGLANGSRN